MREFKPGDVVLVVKKLTFNPYTDLFGKTGIISEEKATLSGMVFVKIETNTWTFFKKELVHANSHILKKRLGIEDEV